MTAIHNLFQWAPLGLPAYVFLITVVVFFHELGHFTVARWCGVKVETFSIGFGPEIVGWFDRKGTRWKISWIPFGGYVKFFGDADAVSTPDREKLERLSTADRRIAFPHEPLLQRAAIVAAGPVANFLLAIVIFAAFLFGAMNAGSAVLQMMTNVSKYLVQVLQFIIVLILAAQFSLSWWGRRRAGRSWSRSTTLQSANV